MNLKTFIDRPILSVAISIFLVLVGIIGLAMLPVEQYPDIAPPTIRVSTTYSGANATAVQNAVTCRTVCPGPHPSFRPRLPGSVSRCPSVRAVP